MQFPFQCQKCQKRFDGDYPIGKAPRETRCPSCKGKSKRLYEGMSIAVKIDGDFRHSSSFGEQQKEKNLATAERQKGRTPGLRLAGYKYSDGRVEEARAK